MNKALEHSKCGPFGEKTEDARASRTEVRRAGLLVVLAATATAIALSLWLASSAGIPPVAAAGDDGGTGQVPYFPSLYVNQAGEPSPAPPTF